MQQECLNYPFSSCSSIVRNLSNLINNKKISVFHSMKKIIILIAGIVFSLMVIQWNHPFRESSQSEQSSSSPNKMSNDLPSNSSPPKLERIICSDFREWQRRFGKFYLTEQETIFRRQVFLKNLVNIQMHNKLYEQGLSLYFKDTNRLADLTPQEFTELFSPKQPETTFNVQTSAHSKKQSKSAGVSNTKECLGAIMDSPNPPAEMDWGNKVNQPVNQGTCGKDWAMVAISAVQSLYAIKIGQLPVLSSQQLLQCSGDYGNQGCYGGFMDQAFWYIIDNGIATQKSYPDRPVSTCRYVRNMRFTGIDRCARVPSGNYSKIISAIVQQPVSVALDFSHEMGLYSGGIFDGSCTTRLTHGMLLTGYGGKQHGTHYWILRNTLGVDWGIKGYIHLLREEKDGEGKCGVQIWPSVPQNLIESGQSLIDQ